MNKQTVLASVKRWSLLTWARTVDDAKPLGLAAAVVAGINLVTLVLFREPIVFGATWPMLIVLGSVILASSVFRSMHTGRSTTDFLLWPATSLEKYAAALAEALVVVPVALTLGATLLSAVFGGVGHLVSVTGESNPVWFPWNSADFGDVAAFEVFLLVLVTGAATFRKHALWKTGLVIVAVAVVVTLLAAAVFGAWSGSSWSWNHRSMGLLFSEQGLDARHVGTVALGAMEFLAKLWYFGIVPVFCLVFGWSKVHEKEARDEVQ